MKQAGSLLLIIILLLQSVGVLLFYQVRQCYVHYEMQEVLNNSETQFEKLTLTLGEFNNSKIGRDEISVNGNIYDVKSVRISGDKVELLAIIDMDEENILEKIKKAVNTGMSQNSEFPNHLVTLISMIYVSPNTGQDFLLEETFQNCFHSFCEIIFSHKSEISSPPPKLV